MAEPEETIPEWRGRLDAALEGFNASHPTRCFLRAYIEGERIRLNPGEAGRIGRIVRNPDGGENLVITGTTPDGRVVNINVHRADPTSEHNQTTIRIGPPNGHAQLFEYNESILGGTSTFLYRGQVVTDANGIDGLPSGDFMQVLRRAGHYSYEHGPVRDMRIRDGAIEMELLPGRRVHGGDTPFTPEGIGEHQRILDTYIGCRIGMGPSNIRVGAIRGPTASA